MPPSKFQNYNYFTNSVFETLSFGCCEIGRKEITPSFSFNFRGRQTSRRRNKASPRGVLSNFKYKSTEIWPLHTQLIKFFNVNKEEYVFFFDIFFPGNQTIKYKMKAVTKANYRDN